MANLIQVQSGAKAFGARSLLDDVTFALNEGEHVGVIGPNGAGKSTLFKILLGSEELDQGQVTRANHLRLGYLEQDENWRGSSTGRHFLEEHCTLPIWELIPLALNLGVSEKHLDAELTSLSGGYRMRIKLVHLIGNEPNLMLLDEPTNYLDLETLLVLENWLLSFKGAFLLISHDREFLRRVTDHTLEIEGGQVTKFNGHIDDYFEQKQMLEEQLEVRAASLASKRSAILEFVAKYGAKATKARQAQSRLKSLQKMEQIEMKPLPSRARIVIPEPVRTGQEVCRLEEADLGYEGEAILKEVHVQVKRGDHLAVVGVNGAGKSTLLKALGGLLKPLAGAVQCRVEIGYFAQHVATALHPEMTVFQALGEKAHPDVTTQVILNLAGSLLFSGDDVEKKISVLSGGEKSRVALGQILLKRSPFLLLDEPTNHLDFHTVEALTQALETYPGTVVVVSHDRGFIRRVATRILEIRGGRVSVYPGTYDEYVWSLQKGFLQDLNPSAEPTRDTQERQTPDKINHKEQRKALEKRVRQLEKDAAACEQKVDSLSAEILKVNDELLKASGQQAQQILIRLSELQTELASTEESWLEASLELQKLKPS